MTRTVPITVTIPVGPFSANRRWLGECLESINAQTVMPDEVLLIDDQAGLQGIEGVTIWRTPWRSGVDCAFNYGVALARNDLVIMLGSDDKLLPGAVERAWEVWSYTHDPLGYYAFEIVYPDGREQNTPCNGAMVHKDLWKLTGGFPVESGIGACDTFLLSIMIAAEGRLGNIYGIGPRPLYWYREHAETDTALRGEMYDVMVLARDVYIRKVLKGINETAAVA